MPKVKRHPCKHTQCDYMTRSRNNYKEELKNHYANECEFESDSDNESDEHWVPHGVLVQVARDAVLVARNCASRSEKHVNNIYKDAAIMVARRAAKAAENAAKEVSMCGRLTLKELQFFSKTNDVKKYKEVYEGIATNPDNDFGKCDEPLYELECDDMFDVWDHHNADRHGMKHYHQMRIECLQDHYKTMTFKYRSCNCKEHFTITTRKDAEKVNEKWKRRMTEGRLHHYKYCEQTAVAFKNKDKSNPLYKRYYQKYAPKWPACPHCGATHSTKAYHETHTLKCKYNINNPLQKNLIEVPIFEENESIVKDKIVLQYNFFKPVKVYVSKKDIRKVTNSETKNVIAYSLDSNHKPVQRYLIHQISKWRMPDELKEDKSYPFKHAYAFTKEQSTTTDTFNWVVAV